MIAPYSPRVQNDGVEYYPEPYSAFHLSDSLRVGLIPLGLVATLSATSSLALISFIIGRIITWRRHYRTFVGYNQYVILVLNLLLADFQQASAFLISWYWFSRDEILAPSSACFAQGWLLHSGDVSSGFLVLAIAVHTYYTAVYGRRLEHKTFVAIIIAIWISAYFLTAIGVFVHGRKYFVRAGAWCWVSSAFEIDRLWCHYIWVFFVEFSSIAIYLLTFWVLRQRTRSLLIKGENASLSPTVGTLRKVNRVAMLMTLYPCVYVLLTLPLSAGRMWSMSHGGMPTSDAFSIVAGSLITSCGWVDSLLYTLTRKRLLQDTMPGGSPQRSVGATWQPLQPIDNKGITHTQTVTVETNDLVESQKMGNAAHVTSPVRWGKVSVSTVERSHSPASSTDDDFLVN